MSKVRIEAEDLAVLTVLAQVTHNAAESEMAADLVRVTGEDVSAHARIERALRAAETALEASGQGELLGTD